MKKILVFACVIAIFASCNEVDSQQKSDSGIAKATTKIVTNPDGTSVEQRNIIDRLKRDNEIGSIKHLYIISSYSGDVMEYSTVKGKVTSGGKRLSPKTVQAGSNSSYGASNYVRIDGTDYTTEEVLDDGGAYGDSGNYLYWFDAQGNYHQYYPSGGTYLHISDKPLKVHKANFSLTQE